MLLAEMAQCHRNQCPRQRNGDRASEPAGRSTTISNWIPPKSGKMPPIMGRNGSLLVFGVFVTILELFTSVDGNMWTTYNSNAYQTRRRSGPSNQCPTVGNLPTHTFYQGQLDHNTRKNHPIWVLSYIYVV